MPPAQHGGLKRTLRTLADLPDETITPLAATRAQHEQGFDVPKNHVANRFFGMKKHGVLVRVELGRYRIVQTHPEMAEVGAMRMTHSEMQTV